MSQPLIDYIKDKKILLLGFGREGRSSYSYIRRHLPDLALTVADMKEQSLDDKNVETIFGENYLDCVNDFDIVFKSPGISFRDVEVRGDTEITCQTDLFLRFAPCVKVGITGTKGKTTTSTLIFDILQAAGVPSCLIGNIGVPVLDLFDSVSGKTAVIEMSSHQLEFTRMSPHVAVFTNLYEEHLDHYNGFDGYAAAKLNIMKNQCPDDFFVYDADTDYSGYKFPDSALAKKIPVSFDLCDSSEFLSRLTRSNEHLRGEHNRKNILLATAAARALSVSDDDIAKGIELFAGIEHRMELVGEYKGIRFYNDCIATVPRAVMCALEALPETDTLIFGGMDRGLDYAEFSEFLSRCGAVNLIGMPQTGHDILNRLKARGCDKTLVFADDMENAVESAFRLTRKGKICLLSPAAASYNRYKDFEEKGRHYKTLIGECGK